MVCIWVSGAQLRVERRGWGSGHRDRGCGDGEHADGGDPEHRAIPRDGGGSGERDGSGRATEERRTVPEAEEPRAVPLFDAFADGRVDGWHAHAENDPEHRDGNGDDRRRRRGVSSRQRDAVAMEAERHDPAGRQAAS